MNSQYQPRQNRDCLEGRHLKDYNDHDYYGNYIANIDIDAVNYGCTVHVQYMYIQSENFQ